MSAARAFANVFARVQQRWLPRAAWSLRRTGRAGLAGLALLLAAAVFFASTHLEVAGEVDALRDQLAAAQGQPRAPRATPVASSKSAPAAGALPARGEMPALLRQIFGRATQARLAVDTGKYETDATEGAFVVRHHLAFPVTAPYPQIRSFLDATLAAMPSVALGELVLDRKAIGDGDVEAQIKLTVFTAAGAGPAAAAGAGSAGAAPSTPIVAARAGSAGAAPSTPIAAASVGSAGASPSAAGIAAPVVATRVRLPADRVAPASHAASLFAPHSWYVAPPPPPPVAKAPPPAPVAPPFPYSFIGSYAPEGHTEVFFLAHGDRVVDARVGDKLDGVYLFESAAGGQLAFVYLPLQTRQTLAAGAPQ